MTHVLMVMHCSCGLVNGWMVIHSKLTVQTPANHLYENAGSYSEQDLPHGSQNNTHRGVTFFGNHI